MAKRSTTPTFVAEFPLGVARAQESVLEKRFRAVASLYNGTLGEALRRAGVMRADPDWAAARVMPVNSEKARKDRSAAFRRVADRHGFTQHAIQKYSTEMRDRSWIGHHMGGHDTQTTSLRAFRAVADWVYKGRGRPRFKPGAQFSSVEGKQNSTIGYRNGAVVWAGLKLPLLRKARDHGNWERDCLERDRQAIRTKYVRIVRRKLRGRMRYYAQLVQEGQVPKRNLVVAEDGVGGLDFGPSVVAAFAPGKVAALLPMAPSVVIPARKITLLQRKMDRSRRASNPDNYNPNGTVKRGVRMTWNRSNRYMAVQAQKSEIERCLAEGRSRDHGTLANQLLSLCAVWNAEKLSYRSFQKNFGRSVARCAPSMLLSTLARKAASAGGAVVEFPTRSTRLSQFDHSTRLYVKKPLSQRIHVFGDPRIAPVQRDLYSAFLACHVEKNLLSTASVSDAWPGAESLLRQPVAELNTICERVVAFGASDTGRPVRADRLQKATHGKTGSVSNPSDGEIVLSQVSVADAAVLNTHASAKKPNPLRNGPSGRRHRRGPGPARIPRL